MTLQVVSNQLGVGGSNLTDTVLRKAIKELQGLNVTLVAGAAAGTKMDIPAMRIEDTILNVLVSNDGAAAALASDTANVTIQTTKAFGTLTVSGNPLNAETFVVNDGTYAFKTVPTAITDVLITAGNSNAMAAAVGAAINAYENRYDHAPNVVATVSTNVVTVTSIKDGVGNGIVLTGTVTVLAAAGSTTASATLTPATVIATNTFVLSGVTFTARAAPTLDNEFMVKGTNLLQGIEIVRAINAYEDKYSGVLDAVATNHPTTGVVTIVPRTALAGNVIPLTETATNFAVTGSGTLTGGTNTGGFKSSTNLTAKSVIVYWFNKQ